MKSDPTPKTKRDPNRRLAGARGSALAERAAGVAKLATEHQRAGDSVKALAAAIIAAQLLQLHKLLYEAPNNGDKPSP